MRITGLLLGLLLPLAPQDKQDERVERILKRIDEVLGEETGRIRRDLTRLVRDEFARQVGGQEHKDSAQGFALITAELLKGHAGTLASDEYEGRNAGFPGNDKAAAYIAEEFKKAGLKPVGDQDDNDQATYLQHFEFRSMYTGGKALKTQNVVGLHEGTDEKLKKEIVVIGAHFDHVGMDGQGMHLGRLGRPTEEDGIWNGADDNGSGTTCLLGLAKAFGEGGLHAKRSILFIAFSAEEAGLYGSKFYCNHPIAPISDHVFMLNLDMVGRNPNKAVQIKGLGSAADGVLKKATQAAIEKAGLKAKLEEGSDIFGGDSDHSSFRNKKVPFIFFFTDFHADYHKPSDHPEKLAYENMVKISHTSGEILISIADSEKRPTFVGGGENPFDFGEEEDPVPVRPSRRLGVEAEELSDERCEEIGLEEGRGGLEVISVSDGSVAEGIGVQTGDVILSLGDTKLSRKSPRSDLRGALESVKPGKSVELVVLRKGERVALTAKWNK